MISSHRDIVIAWSLVLTLVASPSAPTHAGEFGSPHPEAHVERWVLFTAGGPLIIEWKLTIDGRPFRQARERLIQQLMHPGDGGEPLSRSKAESTAASKGASESFILLTNGPADPYAPHTVRTLLDADSDGLLSSEEWHDAPARLQSADTNANDVLARSELQSDAPALLVAKRRSFRSPRSPILLPLGAGFDQRRIHGAMTEYYLGRDLEIRIENTPLAPGLFVALDTDLSNTLDPEELAGMNGHRPHLELVVHLGHTGDLAPGVAVTTVSPELGAADFVCRVKRDDVAIELAGVTIKFSVRTGGANCDENGPRRNDYLLSQITLFQQVDSDPLFTALDANADGRLSLREMRSAPGRLRTLDTNGNGQVGIEEAPQTISLLFGNGPMPFGPIVAAPPITRPQAPPMEPPPSVPDWHTRMDRNADGDISPREFLGTAEQFAALDADGDGLIDVMEAEATNE